MSDTKVGKILLESK